jgi:superfamily I DNA/RNA helicase
MLCSIPPNTASYLQRIGRAGRETGTALIVSVINQRPHDLFFYGRPVEMLRGRVDPPGCWLDASAVLVRQFLAYAFDMATHDGALSQLPRSGRQLVEDLNREDGHLRRMMAWVTQREDELRHRFLQRFEAHIQPDTRERFSQDTRANLLMQHLHQAVRLARDLHDTAARVLVTTFTTNLSYTLRDHIRQLGPDVADRIEVTNLHALAWTICSRCHWKGRIADDDDMAQVWDDVWQDPSLGELPMSKDELQAEYDLVIDPNGIHDEEAYLGTVRSGRPRMSRGQRRQAWQVFRAVQRRLKKRDLLTFEGAIHEARLAVELGNIPRYAHVLVDEVQDFSLEALRLIRALSPIDDNTANPLCTVGDGHQRIYRNKIPMSRAGIDIRGRRSQRLKVNYRTSEQIRQYAQGILEGLDIDDLDGGTAVTVGDHSLFTGPAPSLQTCADAQAEAEVIVAWVQDRLTNQGLATHEICITPYKAPIRTALEAAGIPTFELKPREMDPGEEEPGVRLGSMHRIKGLEFRAVVLACGDVDDPMHRLHEAESRERCTRYVAVTRAREYLLVTVCEPPAA